MEISEHTKGNNIKLFDFLSISENDHLNPWGVLERPSVGGVQILCRVDPAACFQLSFPQMDLKWSQLLGAGAVFSHMVPLVLVMAFAQQPQMFAMAVVHKRQGHTEWRDAYGHSIPEPTFGGGAAIVWCRCGKRQGRAEWRDAYLHSI